MLISIVVAFIVLILLFFSPFRLWLDYRHRGLTEDSMVLQFTALGGLYRRTTMVPVIRSSPEGLVFGTVEARKRGRLTVPGPKPGGLAGYWQGLKDSLPMFLRLYPLYRRRLKVKSFRWQTEVGLTDSYSLALLSGALWAVKGVVVASLCRLFTFKTTPKIKVIPRFGRATFRLSVSCILEIPLGYAIITAVFVLFHKLKLRLKRRSANDERTSNPGADENRHGEHQGNGRCKYCHR